MAADVPCDPFPFVDVQHHVPPRTASDVLDQSFDMGNVGHARTLHGVVFSRQSGHLQVDDSVAFVDFTLHSCNHGIHVIYIQVADLCQVFIYRVHVEKGGVDLLSRKGSWQAMATLGVLA